MGCAEDSPIGWTSARWRDWFAGRGLPAFRGDQVFAWIHRFGVTDPNFMTNLGRALREALAAELDFSPPLSVAAVQRSVDGSVKFGFGTQDGQVVETVLIPGSGRDRRKYTVCVSSQLGCALGCAFCATASMGLVRDLDAAEIVAQVHLVLAHLEAEPGRYQTEGRPRSQWLTNIVYMGMGEPLMNLPAVLRSVDVLADAGGLDFSSRRITISTAGWVPGLEALAAAPDFAGQLAVSLHACEDELRAKLMPVNRRFPLARLKEALIAFPLAARRRITLEYILLDQVNDSAAQARALVRFCQGLRVKVNLIPYHTPGEGASFTPSPPARKAAFTAILQGAGLTVIERASAGADIDAACGQLATGRRPRAPR